MLYKLLGLEDILMDKLRVTLEDEQTINQGYIDLSIWLELLHDSIFLNFIEACKSLLAFTSALMTFQALIRHYTITIRAFEFKFVK
jgi:hypothetical protein